MTSKNLHHNGATLISDVSETEIFQGSSMPDSIMRPVVFGEVLFDEFDDGSRIAGGAPFNVAWHLNGFGLRPLFVSRIGQDEKGQQILKLMQDWQMDLSGLQSDLHHSTGYVHVTLDDGQPEFNIAHPVAYDHIDWPPLAAVLSKTTEPFFLYHGSLAARSVDSSQTLQLLRQQATLIFVDINLRTPWWDKNSVEQLLQHANWIKLNNDELEMLADTKNNKRSDRNEAELFLKKHPADGVILTRGEKGAWLFTAEDIYTSTPVTVNNFVDAVGAGDAFSAVCIYGILHCWDIQITLERATSFASAICQQRGATSLNNSLYESYKQQWDLNR